VVLWRVRVGLWVNACMGSSSMVVIFNDVRCLIVVGCVRLV